MSYESSSFVRKSAPIVALYCVLNFLFTYWFIKDVLPTPESPRMITFNSSFSGMVFLGRTFTFAKGKWVPLDQGVNSPGEKVWALRSRE